VVGLEVDETEDIFKKKKVHEYVHAISNALHINVNWLRTKRNTEEDYWLNYDMVDHRHFHDLNAKQQADSTKGNSSNIPLPEMVQRRSPRRNRKRTFSEMQGDDGNDDHHNHNDRGNLESLRYVAPKVVSMRKEVDLESDPIGWIKRIAMAFPNPDAWTERISELVNGHLNESKDSKNSDKESNDEKDVMDRLFRYLDPEKDGTNDIIESVDIGNGEIERLNHLQVLLCVNRMYTVLIVQIPPNAKGLVNDSKFKNIYPIYGLRDTTQITSSVLSGDVGGLYLFGTLSVGKTESINSKESVKEGGEEESSKNEGDGKTELYKEHKVTFRLSRVVGINQDFVAMKPSESKEKSQSKIESVIGKVLAINCSNIAFVQ